VRQWISCPWYPVEQLSGFGGVQRNSKRDNYGEAKGASGRAAAVAQVSHLVQAIRSTLLR